MLLLSVFSIHDWLIFNLVDIPPIFGEHSTSYD